MVGRERKKSTWFVNMASREEVWDNAKVGETGGENHGAREAARTGRAQGSDESAGEGYWRWRRWWWCQREAEHSPPARHTHTSPRDIAVSFASNFIYPISLTAPSPHPRQAACVTGRGRAAWLLPPRNVIWANRDVLNGKPRKNYGSRGVAS